MYYPVYISLSLKLNVFAGQSKGIFPVQLGRRNEALGGSLRSVKLVGHALPPRTWEIFIYFVIYFVFVTTGGSAISTLFLPPAAYIYPIFLYCPV